MSHSSIDEIAQQSDVFTMVVEDEPLVREFIADALSDGGFQTELAASGTEAVQLLRANVGKYRALITDINMSGPLKGWDVAREARELNPEIPVVYMTGDAAHQWPSMGVPNSLLLRKPFAPAQVVTAVASLLNSVSTSGNSMLP